MRNKWFHIYCENPLKTWWKAKKYFKFPKLKAGFCLVKRNDGYPYARYDYLARILDINIQDLWWKDKYNSPRHEKNPLIYICLFRKLAFYTKLYMDYKDEFGEIKDGSMYYWEYMLKYLHYSKNLKSVDTWTSDSRIYKYTEFKDDEDIILPLKINVPIVSMSLNKNGINKLKQELKS